MELPVKSPVGGGQRTPYRIETRNLSYKLCAQFDEMKWGLCGGAKRVPSFILKNVNCEARPAEITAIAGPSGAGKTTLLEILAGKISPKKVCGQVLVNNLPMEAKSFRRLSGYVTQDDALFPLLTVEETLTYSSMLRRPGGRKEAAGKVRQLMKELGLEHVAASRVGSGSSNNGISGGERRRVSVGVDLVHDPAVILIDEPTSGLDSASAFHIVSLLKTMVVNQGKTIVLTIHQPGFRILEMLDRLVLLSSGSVMHNGSVHLLKERLRFVGHRIPNHVNMLEFAIDVVESLDTQIPEALNNEQNLRGNHKFEHHFHISEGKKQLYRNSRLEEVVILGERFCSNIFRTKQLFVTRVVQALVAGLLLGTIFLNVGREQSTIALQTQTGFFAFSLTFLLSSTTEGLPIFLQERRILMSETTKGAYRVSSYVIANTLIFLPFLLMVGILFSTPVYWLIGLRGDVDKFIYFSLVVWMVLLMSNSVVACFSALVPNFIMGTSVVSGLMGSFFLFSGYFIPKDNIPSYWLFMHYSSLFKYPFECFMINEYGGGQARRCIQINDGECNLYGGEMLRQQNLRETQKWSNLAVMLGFIVGYRILCFLILWYRCYRNRN
ncbi:ABC transporter G family member 10 [Argentina anserina]|uniref:ABC transporter G family member 10 n=1 Tax=Argentina anserina TaxID=57926 RepID=UPI0021767F73|nr:ABC transporter G family member 10 [Potentilla anserina]